MARGREDLFNAARFHNAAGVHDCDAITHVGDNGEVVRNQDEAEPVLLAHPVEQLKDLRLHDHIERRRRLITDQHGGGAREGDCKHGALPLPARELVGVGVESLLWNANIVKQVLRLLLRHFGRLAKPELNRLRYLVANLDHRVERNE